jgi:hypothetical protein
VGLHSVVQRQNVFDMQKCLKMHFVIQEYFVVYERSQKYGIPTTEKLNLPRLEDD